jgi:SnoaL-like domain
VDQSEVGRWVEGYLRAWESNAPQDIEALFTEDARYFTAPHRQPWAGRDRIVQGWLGRKDDQGTWTFRWEVVGIDGDTAFVQGVTTYKDLPDYANLWMIRLNKDGRATEFVEWWMDASDADKTD